VVALERRRETGLAADGDSTAKPLARSARPTKSATLGSSSTTRMRPAGVAAGAGASSRAKAVDSDCTSWIHAAARRGVNGVSRTAAFEFRHAAHEDERRMTAE